MKNPVVSRPLETRAKVSHKTAYEQYHSKMTVKNESIRLYSKIIDSHKHQTMQFTFYQKSVVFNVK